MRCGLLERGELLLDLGQGFPEVDAPDQRRRQVLEAIQDRAEPHRAGLDALQSAGVRFT